MTRPLANERGFALMGAVMFVLVLTILALSLFSLSSFEGQFMRDTMDRSAAYNAALGGLDRARFALGRTSTLASVSSGLPRDSVVYAVARQNADTTGTVYWSGPNANDVTIRVMARYGGEVRFLEARYAADRNRSFYRNLMTLSHPTQGLFVYRDDSRDQPTPPEYAWKATYLSGQLRQNAPNNPDVIFPLGAPPPTVPPLALNFGGAVDPAVAGYISEHSLEPGTTAVTKKPGFDPYVLNAMSDPDSIAFFRTPGPDGAWSLDLNNAQHGSNEPLFRVRVSGTAIWLLERGLRVDRTLQVEGTGQANDMLVIVAGLQNGDADDPGAGIALLGSINSPNVPIILVSDGNVLVEHRDFGGDCSSDNNPSTIGCLSIYARGAWIMGPDANYEYGAGGIKMIFTHAENHPGNDIIDRLVEMGYLPNTQGLIKGKLSPVAGTWREVTETNPVFP